MTKDFGLSYMGLSFCALSKDMRPRSSGQTSLIHSSEAVPTCSPSGEVGACALGTSSGGEGMRGTQAVFTIADTHGGQQLCSGSGVQPRAAPRTHSVVLTGEHRSFSFRGQLRKPVSVPRAPCGLHVLTSLEMS